MAAVVVDAAAPVRRRVGAECDSFLTRVPQERSSHAPGENGVGSVGNVRTNSANSGGSGNNSCARSGDDTRSDNTSQRGRASSRNDAAHVRRGDVHRTRRDARDDDFWSVSTRMRTNPAVLAGESNTKPITRDNAELATSGARAACDESGGSETSTTLRVYMQRNRIPELFNNLSTDVLAAKPDDPVSFMLTWLKKQREMLNES